MESSAKFGVQRPSDNTNHGLCTEEMAAALWVCARALASYQCPRVPKVTHRREGGGGGRSSSPADAGVDVGRDGDLEGRQSL